MVALNLGKKSDWKFIESLSVKEVLDFLSDGTISLNGSSVSPVRSCVCGDRALFVCVNIRPVNFMRCEYDLSFFCEKCFRDHMVGFNAVKEI